MALATRKLHPLFGLEILDVDVTRVDEATFKDIVGVFNEHSVLLFRDQTVTDEQQIAFSVRFGPLEKTIRSIASQEQTLPEIANLANVDAENRLIPTGDKRNIFNAGNQMWHSDSSFKKVPALASLLSGRECPPEGGETEFASMRVAYERLPEDMKRALEGKVAIHSFAYSRGLVDDGLLPPEHAAQAAALARFAVAWRRAYPGLDRLRSRHGSHGAAARLHRGRRVRVSPQRARGARRRPAVSKRLAEPALWPGSSPRQHPTVGPAGRGACRAPRGPWRSRSTL